MYTTIGSLFVDVYTRKSRIGASEALDGLPHCLPLQAEQFHAPSWIEPAPAGLRKGIETSHVACRLHKARGPSLNTSLSLSLYLSHTQLLKAVKDSVLSSCGVRHGHTVMAGNAQVRRFLQALDPDYQPPPRRYLSSDM